MPFPKPSLTSLGVPTDGALQIITCLSKSAEKKPPFQVPSIGPLGRKMPISRAFLYIYLGVPSRRALQIITCLPKSPVKELAPSRFPNGATYGDRYPLPEPSFTYSFSQSKEQPHSKPIHPSLSPLFCPKAVCKSDRLLEVCRSHWAINPVLPVQKIARLRHFRFPLWSSYKMKCPIFTAIQSESPCKEVSWSPSQTEGLHKIQCSLAPQEDHL